MDQKKTETEFEDGRLEEIFEYYGGLNISGDQSLLTELMREIQELFGFLPSDLIPRIAELSEKNEHVIRKLIKLYPSLRLAEFDHAISVCTGVSCGRAGAGELLDAARRAAKELPDARWRISACGCRKHCTEGPVCMVDETLYTRVRPEDIKKLMTEALNRR